MPISDSEPRYRLLDSNGDVVASFYLDDSDGFNIQEATNNNEVTLASDGTFTTPALDTEGAVIGETYHWASRYDGADNETRLDNALSTAVDGDTIYLENATYSTARTITTGVRFVGTGFWPAGHSTIIDNEIWTLNGDGIGLENVAIDADNSGDTVIDVQNSDTYLSKMNNRGGREILVSADEVLITQLRGGDVTFASGTSGGIVDASVNVTVTDNGTNTVGDIA